MKQGNLAFTRKTSCFLSLLVLAAFNQSVVYAQDIIEENAEAIQATLEKPLDLQFVPGEVIVKMRPVASAPAALSMQALTPLGLQASPRRTSGGELIYQMARGIAPVTVGRQTAVRHAWHC